MKPYGEFPQVRLLISQTIFTTVIMPVIRGTSTDCTAHLIGIFIYFIFFVYKLPAAF